ncbi:MAG: transposase family protein [Planctomycetia bacterium]
MASQAKLATLEELVACFKDLEDPRSEINRKHPLVSVVAISMMAVLAGADGPTSIHRWANPHFSQCNQTEPLESS